MISKSKNVSTPTDNSKRKFKLLYLFMKSKGKRIPWCFSHFFFYYIYCKKTQLNTIILLLNNQYSTSQRPPLNIAYSTNKIQPHFIFLILNKTPSLKYFLDTEKCWRTTPSTEGCWTIKQKLSNLAIFQISQNIQKGMQNISLNAWLQVMASMECLENEKPDS